MKGMTDELIFRIRKEWQGKSEDYIVSGYYRYLNEIERMRDFGWISENHADRMKDDLNKIRFSININTGLV